MAPSAGVTAFVSTPNATATVVLPPNVRDGDQVWVALIATAAADFSTVPAGYSEISGASFDLSVPLGVARRFGVYRHTWHTGDPTTVTFIHPTNAIGWICFLVRSDGTPSIVTDSHTNGNSGAGGTISVPSFAPSTVYDLRLMFAVIENISNGAVPPAIAPNTDNPAGVKAQRLIQSRPQANVAPYIEVAYSLWSDPAGSDVGASVWTGEGTLSNYYSRAVTVTDGTSHNGGTPADVEELFVATPDPRAYSLAIANAEEESANANWWGGGINTLGDHD